MHRCGVWINIVKLNVLAGDGPSEADLWTEIRSGGRSVEVNERCWEEFL